MRALKRVLTEDPPGGAPLCKKLCGGSGEACGNVKEEETAGASERLLINAPAAGEQNATGEPPAAAPSQVT